MERHQPGKSDCTAMWHRVSYCSYLPKGALPLPTPTSGQICQNWGWDLQLQSQFQLSPQPNKVNFMRMKWVTKMFCSLSLPCSAETLESVCTLSAFFSFFSFSWPASHLFISSHLSFYNVSYTHPPSPPFISSVQAKDTFTSHPSLPPTLIVDSPLCCYWFSLVY